VHPSPSVEIVPTHNKQAIKLCSAISVSSSPNIHRAVFVGQSAIVEDTTCLPFIPNLRLVRVSMPEWEEMCKEGKRKEGGKERRKKERNVTRSFLLHFPHFCSRHAGRKIQSILLPGGECICIVHIGTLLLHQYLVCTLRLPPCSLRTKCPVPKHPLLSFLTHQLDINIMHGFRLKPINRSAARLSVLSSECGSRLSGCFRI